MAQTPASNDDAAGNLFLYEGQHVLTRDLATGEIALPRVDGPEFLFEGQFTMTRDDASGEVALTPVDGE